MKKLIILLSLFSILFCACKKDSKSSGKLVIEVTNITSGSYSFSITNSKTNTYVFGADYKTENAVYETAVNSGDELSITTSSTGPYMINFKYDGKSVGSSSLAGPGKTKTTVFIP